MSNIAKLPVGNSTDDTRSLALIRRTVASDCNDAEFDLFIWTARHLGLDPLRRQIFALVYNKDKPAKRKMTIITAIDGFRAIADRTGNYRPDEDEPTLEIDPAIVSESNPAGIVKASVRVFKYAHGSWHKVTASAYWSEFAPVRDGWSETKRVQDGTWPDGNPKYREVPADGAKKIQVLDTSGQWGKMPRVMISKCAEAQALRKAWPDAFSGVATDDETDRARVLEMSASEAAEEGERAARLEKIGSKDAVPLTFDAAGTIELVPVGKAADRCFEFIKAHKDEPSQVMLWRDRNKAALREFWAKAPSDALAVKQEIEKAIGQ